MGLEAFMKAVADFIVGPFGISAITLAIGFMALGAAFNAIRWFSVFMAIFAGAILFSSGWIVTQFLSA